MAYNTERVNPEDAAKRHAELLDPKWAGKIVVERDDWPLVPYMSKVVGQSAANDSWTKLGAMKPTVVAGPQSTYHEQFYALFGLEGYNALVAEWARRLTCRMDLTGEEIDHTDVRASWDIAANDEVRTCAEEREPWQNH